MEQLTVYVKGFPVTFNTDLTWPDAINILRELAKTNNFAASLLEREDKNLHMSQSQICWVYKLAEDARKAQNEEPKQDEPKVSAENIRNSLLSALEKGLKRPSLRLNYDQDGETYQVKINYVKSSDKCWITINSLLETKSLVGMIDYTGDLKAFGSGLLQLGISVESFTEWVSEINGNVLSALEAYGKLTSTCSCCGLPLTNKKSIELGIGPICLEKYGLMAAI